MAIVGEWEGVFMGTKGDSGKMTAGMRHRKSAEIVREDVRMLEEKSFVVEFEAHHVMSAEVKGAFVELTICLSDASVAMENIAGALETVADLYDRLGAEDAGS